MISVIIPAYNCAEFLEDSARSALGQTHRDLEVLILDDASGDDTPVIANRLAEQDSRVRAFSNAANLGVAETRNRGLEEARGEWVAFLDGDDLWLPDKLEKQLARLSETGGDLCYTGYSFINEAGTPIRTPYRIPEDFRWETLLRENIIGCSTALFRRPADPPIRMRGEYQHEDYVFWLELIRSGYRPVGLDQPLMRYRVSPSNRSGNKTKAAAGRWKIFRQFLRFGRIRSASLLCSYGLRGLCKHFFSR